jgi:replication initiation and membrane attachment protein DnaB
LIEKGGKTDLDKTRFALKAKESQLVQYLEEHTTEEIINEVHERWFPSFHFQPNLLIKLKKLKLAQPVLNTLIFYVLATNNQRSLTHKLLVLGHICREFNLKSSYEAITFFKQYYAFQIRS